MESDESKGDSTSFLHIISNKKVSPVNVTDEIYEKEQRSFCQRMIKKLNSPKSLSPILEITKKISISSRLTEKLKLQYMRRSNKKVNISLPPVKNIKVGASFPGIKSPQLSPFKQTKRKFSIGKILSIYQEGVEQSSTTKNLKTMATRDSYIAREYIKEIIKTSEILKEVNEFQTKMKKELYDEIKSSAEDYEQEKEQIIKEFTQKVVLSKNYKLKNSMNLKHKIKNFN